MGEAAAQRLILTGPVLATLGAVILAVFLLQAGDHPAVLVAASLRLILIGLGVGIAWSRLVDRSFRVAPPRPAGPCIGQRNHDPAFRELGRHGAPPE
ncbi:hypothetical protein GHV40_16065 [Devosia sp. D6-9]|nr:hypothetical protein GHV40_16065 [Devosia sp. D6-9]